MQLTGVTLGLAGAGTAVAGGSDASGDENDAKESAAECDLDGVGLVTVESDECFEETVDRIEEAIEANEDLTPVATIDHAANADSAGLELRPTTLFLFGNPEVGTPLMQESQSAGIDLPQKLLVWEDEDGEVLVTYNDSEFLADRHGIEGQDERIGMVSTLLRTLATGESDE